MIEYLKTWLPLKSDKRAVTMLEYGLMAALIAVVCIGTVTQLGAALSAKFAVVQGAVAAAGG